MAAQALAGASAEVCMGQAFVSWAAPAVQQALCEVSPAVAVPEQHILAGVAALVGGSAIKKAGTLIKAARVKPISNRFISILTLSQTET